MTDWQPISTALKRAKQGVEIRPDDKGAIDEIVARNCRTLHIERLSDDGWFMGIDASDGSYWQFWFGSKNRKAHVEFRHTETSWGKGPKQMTYSASDFDNEASEFAKAGVSPSAVTIAALRIASLVMREGVIEETLDAIGNGMLDDAECRIYATAIRNRLTGETG